MGKSYQKEKLIGRGTEGRIFAYVSKRAKNASLVMRNTKDQQSLYDQKNEEKFEEIESSITNG